MNETLPGPLVEAAGDVLSAVLEALGDGFRAGLEKLMRRGHVQLELRVRFAVDAESADVLVLGIVNGEARLQLAQFHVNRTLVN